MTAHRASKTANPGHQKHGLTVLKRALKQLGGRAIDRRSSLGKALAQWRDQLAGDLGGAQALSIQQETMIDLCVRTKLMLDTVDTWLLTTKGSLVNRRKKALFPAVLQRQQLADSLARYMTTLGLERKAKKIPALSEYVADKYGAKEEAR